MTVASIKTDFSSTRIHDVMNRVQFRGQINDDQRHVFAVLTSGNTVLVSSSYTGGHVIEFCKSCKY